MVTVPDQDRGSGTWKIISLVKILKTVKADSHWLVMVRLGVSAPPVPTFASKFNVFGCAIMFVCLFIMPPGKH